MRRFSWQETIEYWEAHAASRAPADCQDPEGLGNVCQADAPRWLNRHYARGQRFVFRRLLRRVPAPMPGASALDVGCGAARWSALLMSEGYSVVGIDLQPSLIESNSKRFPNIQFFRSSIQDFTWPEPFDLIVSVTVLQHLPHGEQLHAIRAIARLLRPGGYMIALENIVDQDPHVFANTIIGWKERFAVEGLQSLASCRYDYNPALRNTSALLRRAKQFLPITRTAPDSTGNPPRMRLAKQLVMGGAFM